jgi:hypothetical protein
MAVCTRLGGGDRFVTGLSPEALNVAVGGNGQRLLLYSNQVCRET